ncbi:hypothetical protein [Caudoviricetes sp.]|nr:hypothetical protein [Caudoviricetes sp.]
MIPASIRNNNPGAQEPGPSSKKFGSTAHEKLLWTYKGKAQVNKIATFPTKQHGAAAMFDLLYRKYTGRPISQAIEKWCGGYYAGAYAKALEANGGVKETDELTRKLLETPDFAIPLCKAMARVEAGRDFPMTDEEWIEAHAMAFGTGAAPEFSPDNDVPSPGPKARAIAEAKEIAKIAVPAGGVVGTGATVATKSPETPAPKIDAKAAIAKGKETRETIEQAKDLGLFAKDFIKWGVGDGAIVVGGIGAALAIGIAWNWWRK